MGGVLMEVTTTWVKFPGSPVVVPRKVLGGGILHAGGTFGEEQSLLDRLLTSGYFWGSAVLWKDD